MWKKLIVSALAVSTIGFASAPASNAGTEMVDQYSQRDTYNNAPPPRPAYYAPPPVGVAFYPSFGYRPFRGYRFHRGRRFYRHDRYWR
jgi:hypothetical protein